MWRWFLSFVGCPHKNQIRDTSLPGVLRLRCMDCLKTSEGITIGPQRYQRTYSAVTWKLRLRTWGIRRRAA